MASPLLSPLATISLRAVRLSQLESRQGWGETEGRTGERKWRGNLSGVVGEEGEKRRCRLRIGGGVELERKVVGRLEGEELGVT